MGVRDPWISVLYSKIGCEKYIFQDFISVRVCVCAYVHMYMCSWGVEVGVPIVMLGAVGEYENSTERDIMQV